MLTSSVGESPLIAATTSLQNMWQPAPGRFTARSFQVLMALTPLRATHFTRAVGTTTTAGAGPLMCQWTN